MNDEQWIILALKIVLLADVISVALFIAQYTRLAPWWRSEIGRTIVVKDVLLILALTPSVLSLFFHLNRFTSHLAAWADVVFFGALAPVMLWRIVVWQRIHKNKAGALPADSTAEGDL